MEQQEQTTTPQVTPKPWRRFLRRAWRVLWVSVLAVFTLFVIVYLLLQVPFVQTWAAKKVTNSLSTSMGTHVELEQLSISFFDKLVLRGFYVEDFNQDTLLYSQELIANINTNPISYLRRGLEIEEINLKTARFFIRKPIGSEQNTLQQVLVKLFPKDTTSIVDPNKKPFRLNLDLLTLDDVQFIQDDRFKGQQLSIYLERGEIDLNFIDLPGKKIDAKYVELTRPIIRINEIERDPAYYLLTEEDTDEPDGDSTTFQLKITELRMDHGVFGFHNYRNSPVKTTAANMLDYNHMEVFDINMEIDSFFYDIDEYIYEGIIHNVSFEETSGFELTSLRAKEAIVSPLTTTLRSMKLETPYSSIGDSLILKYNSFRDYIDYVDSVSMSIYLSNALVSFQDIMVFAPALEENQFFKNNKNEALVVDGEVYGSVNKLSGRDLLITLADGTTINGRFSSDNLAVRDEERMDITLKKLVTSMRTMRQIFPNFNPPANFDRLGRLDFSGTYYGFFEDFVAFGNLKTDIGRASLDMHLNVREGRARASYNGDLRLQNFDLGRWSGNPDLGIINFSSEVLESTGLTANTVDAKVKGEIQDVFYKGYQYKNAQISGDLQKNLFNGEFKIQDENIDFYFSGKLDFTEPKIPQFDFKASINKLDLDALNILKEAYTVNGEFDLSLTNRSDQEMQGTGILNNIMIIHNDTSQYFIDSIKISSLVDTSGQKRFLVESDVLNADIDGDFDVLEIPKALQQYAQTYFPGFSRQAGLVDSIALKHESEFNFDILIKDTKGLNELLHSKLGRIKNAKAVGQFRRQAGVLELEVDMGKLAYDQFEFKDIFLDIETEQNQGDFEFVVYGTDMDGEPLLAPVTALSILDGDTIKFGLNVSTTSANFIDNLNFNGQVSLIDSNYFQVNFNQSNLAILEDIWVIDKDNNILLSKDSVFIEDFVMTNKGREVLLNSINGKMVDLRLNNFNFNFIDRYWKYDPLDFEGNFTAEIQVQNIFKLEGINAAVTSDTVFINDDDFGWLRLDVEAENLKKPLYANLSLTKDTIQLLAEGYYNLPDIEVAPGEKDLTKQANYYAFDVNIVGFPLSISEYFIGNNVKDVTGSLNAALQFFGKPGNPNISGLAYATAGAFTIDYLKTRYYFNGADINIDNKLFDASGLVLRDRLGNRANVYGGITHDHLSNFGLNARLNTTSFLALDTKKADNPLYYGQAIGAGNIIFTGSFDRTDIFIDASVGAGTNIILPLAGNSQDASKLDFVDFVDPHGVTANRNGKTSNQERNQLGGLSIEMNLNVNEEARVNLVFNEQTGDIVQGNGRGNIQILVPRGGQLQMFGDYVIERGSYLFTLYNFASKQFSVKRGGIIQWSGDPFKAQINLEAEYGDVNTSVANLIQEYLLVAPEGVREQASQSTDVDLTMRLRGELLQPVIDFDIEFPQLQGELQSYADSKLRILRQDQNEMNRQVFGLIVVGQFLPADFTFSGSDVIYNTLSEFVSNQLSLLITDLFSEVLEDGTVLSGIDFDIAYYQSQSINFGDGQDVNAGEEFQVSQRLNFFNDRLSVTVGGNVEIGNSFQAGASASGTFVGNDLVIEYALNDDRSLKLRIYQRLQPDIGGGRRLQLGTGLSFRKEFNSFSEFFKSFRKDAESVKRPEN